MRKNQEIANIVNGLMSQFTVSGDTSPLGSRRTPTIDPKSIWTIIGKIIAQMRIATGTDTLAYSYLDRVSGIPGSHWPSATPTTIANATHRVR
jgi:hypothetical protein